MKVTQQAVAKTRAKNIRQWETHWETTKNTYIVQRSFLTRARSARGHCALGNNENTQGVIAKRTVSHICENHVKRKLFSYGACGKAQCDLSQGDRWTHKEQTCNTNPTNPTTNLTTLLL